jgi:hypothetical protein
MFRVTQARTLSPKDLMPVPQRACMSVYAKLMPASDARKTCEISGKRGFQGEGEARINHHE